MYVSYAVGVAIAFSMFLLANILIGLGRLDTFIFITTTLFVLLPVIVRVSRNIWINFFFSYKKDPSNNP